MALKGQDVLVCLDLAQRDGAPWTYQALPEDLDRASARPTTPRAGRSRRDCWLRTWSAAASRRSSGRRCWTSWPTGSGTRSSPSPGGSSAACRPPTAPPPLDRLVRSGDEPPLVWPDAEGEQRGQEVRPLYRTAPKAARRNPRLYELLALTDAVRCGSARERDLAVEALRERLLGPAEG